MTYRRRSSWGAEEGVTPCALSPAAALPMRSGGGFFSEGWGGLT